MADGAIVIDVNLHSDEAAEEASQLGGKLSNFVKKGLGAVSAAVGAATTAAAATIADIGKQAVNAYADFEQLEGGVETLFGNSADKVMTNAAKAFETAGLSANAYMETVTGFSAALIESVGGNTLVAAEMADMAIRDMSDNANKMGSNMESIQNAYSGFAKGNFTMLDNLKLGYGGTKEEMQRLLDKAEEISGIEYDISSYADIVNAIHVVQTEMGITGTTAQEAASTISGSLSMTKSAWDNLVAGMANPDADIGALVGDVVTSVEAVVSNLAPVISGMLPTIAEGLLGLAEELLPLLTETVSELLPGLLDGALQLVSAFSGELPGLVSTVTETLVAALPDLISAAIDFLLNSVTLIIETGVTLLCGIVDAMPEAIIQIVDALPTIITSIIDTLMANIDKLIDAGVKLFVALVQNLPQIITTILKAVPEIVSKLVTAFVNLKSKLADAGRQMIEGLWNGISDAAAWLWDKISGFCSNLLGRIKNFFGIASPSKIFKNVIGKNLMTGWAEGIEDNAGLPVKAMEGAAVDVNSAAAMGAINSEIGRIRGVVAAEMSVSAGSLNTNYGASADMRGAIASTAQSGSGKTVIEFTGSLAQLGRVLQPVIIEEGNRLGDDLVMA